MPRLYDSAYLYEVTMRTLDGMWHFDAHDPDVHSAIMAAMARAQSKHKVKVHVFTFMSNHFHALYGIDDPDDFAAFLRHLHAALARLANRRANRRGAVWHGPAHVVPVAMDEATQLRRLAYILGQGVRAGAVTHPSNWPAASSTPWLLNGERLTGRYFDQTAWTLASRNGKQGLDREAFSREVELEMTPLPCLAHLSPEARQAACRTIADGIAESARETAKDPPSATTSAEVPRSQPPARRAPVHIHAASDEARREFLKYRDAFLVAYAEARRQLREAAARAAEGRRAHHVVFPPFSFASPAPGRSLTRPPKA